MEADDDDGTHGHILLLDDDRALGGYLARALSSGGYDVAYELTAEVALLRVQAEQWDLLITDVELPGISPQLRALISPVILAALLERVSAHLEVKRNHPLVTRRYYRRVSY